MLRILQVGLGPLGLRIARDLHERKLGRIVEAVDVSPDLAGRTLSDLTPLEGWPAVPTRASLDEVVAWDVDACVVTTSSRLDQCAPTFHALLARGLSVVSTCEQLAWPWLAHPRLAAELHDAAVAHGGRLVGVGVNPGYLMDALPVFATAACRSVWKVDVWRVQDATSRRVPFQQKIGVGLTAEELSVRMERQEMGHVGLGESLHFVAASLGWTLESWEEDYEPILALRELPSGLGPVAPGRVAGIKQTARGSTSAGCVVELEFRAALGQAEPHDRIQVHGDPPIDMTIAGGVHGDTATCALALNAIPALARAAPGLHTMATIPLAHFVR